ncbi:hypothetical protein QBC31_22245 [Streptomyces sp. B21-079]|uniref:hypothetical protein n=1 Tax=Streptomyces sp. B21-079 TaxID=3039409 RepID=UPI002FEFB4DA
MRSSAGPFAGCAKGERKVSHGLPSTQYARLLKEQGRSLGQIEAKTGIPKASLHRYLTEVVPSAPEDAP